MAWREKSVTRVAYFGPNLTKSESVLVAEPGLYLTVSVFMFQTEPNNSQFFSQSTGQRKQSYFFLLRIWLKVGQIQLNPNIISNLKQT